MNYKLKALNEAVLVQPALFFSRAIILQNVSQKIFILDQNFHHDLPWDKFPWGHKLDFDDAWALNGI